MASTMRQQSLFSGHLAISFWSDSKDLFRKPGSHSTTLDHIFLSTTRVVVGGLLLHIHMLSVSRQCHSKLFYNVRIPPSIGQTTINFSISND